jgi:hypothetical protein
MMNTVRMGLAKWFAWKAWIMRRIACFTMHTTICALSEQMPANI